MIVLLRVSIHTKSLNTGNRSYNVLICEQNSQNAVDCFFLSLHFFFSILSFGRNFAFKVIATNNINNHNRYYNNGIFGNNNSDSSSSSSRANKRRQTGASFLMNYMFYSIILSLSRVATMLFNKIAPCDAM